MKKNFFYAAILLAAYHFGNQKIQAPGNSGGVAIEKKDSTATPGVTGYNMVLRSVDMEIAE